MARAEKHKTKYKESSIKDFKKSQKQEARKDLKDYTAEDKDGGMNPNSVGEPQTNVLRKRDKLVIDDVDNMVPNKKDVADYYKVEGDHDPKYTAKKRKEIQNEDEKDSKDQIEDKIENLKREQLEKKISKLTEEQKERLVREYIRKKIKKVLSEQKALKDINEAPEDEEAPEEEGGEVETDVEGGGEEAEDEGGEEEGASTPPAPPTTSTPPAPPTTSTPATVDDDASDSEATDDVEAAEDKETEEILDDTLSAEQKKKKAIMKQSLVFQKSDNGRTSADALKPMINLGIDNLDAENQKSFYLTLKKLADKNLRA